MGTFSFFKYPMEAQRYAEIVSFIGIDGKTDDEKIEKLIAKISELKESIGIKKTIKDYGIDEKEFLEKLDEMVEHAFDDQCTGANPRYPLMKELKEIYLKAYYGK
jgi:acetaldehyde dehydrogenase/alcohol dehydrogenase